MLPHPISKATRSLQPLLRGCIICALAAFLVSHGADCAAAAKQKTFSSPDAAAADLFKAVQDSDAKKWTALFGPGSEALASSGDEVEDRQCREQFLSAWGEQHRLEKGAGGKVSLYVGKDDWPFPIPIVRQGKRWRFDTKAGAHEILSRRIGDNELSAIQVCLAIADAQRDYADELCDLTGMPEYAQKFESTKGAKDGLYWEAKPGEEPSPLGPLVARARAEGYATGVLPEPYHGYLYKILKAQGKHAKGGAYEYVINGRMIGGFAVVAYPAVYGASGVNTFISNHDGIVYRKDLGKKTAGTAEAMTAFDPDETWKKVE
jgi:hypothetical protein